MPLNLNPGIEAERSTERGICSLLCNSAVPSSSWPDISAGMVGSFVASDVRVGDWGDRLGVVITTHMSARWRSMGYRLTFPSREKTARIGLMRLPLGKSKCCGPWALLSIILTSAAGVTASLAIFPDRWKLNRAVISDAVGLASTIRTERC